MLSRWLVSSVIAMWRSFASAAIGGTIGPKNDLGKPDQAGSECSDDEVSSSTSGEEGLECPICCESFNIVENIPYVLWCGHTLCKNCVLGLQWAVVKFPTLPIQLPLFISCPWCNLLSFRLVYKGNLKFPRKNFFLLWMVESMNGDRGKMHSVLSGEHQRVWSSNNNSTSESQVNYSSLRRAPSSFMHREQSLNQNRVSASVADYWNLRRFHSSVCKSLVFFMNLTAKFPLVLVFLLIVLYAIPASVAVLILYILITLLFALPSFLILYFAYPCLDWLVREIITWNANHSIPSFGTVQAQYHATIGCFFPHSIIVYLNSLTSLIKNGPVFGCWMKSLIFVGVCIWMVIHAENLLWR